jgi:hypothetical protein
VEDQLAQAAPLGRMLVPLQPLGTQAPAAAAAVLTRQQEVQRSLAALGELDGRLDALREQAGALGSLFARDGVVLEAVLGGPPAGALSARYSPRRAALAQVDGQLSALERQGRYERLRVEEAQDEATRAERLLRDLDERIGAYASGIADPAAAAAKAREMQQQLRRRLYHREAAEPAAAPSPAAPPSPERASVVSFSPVKIVRQIPRVTTPKRDPVPASPAKPVAKSFSSSFAPSTKRRITENRMAHGTKVKAGVATPGAAHGQSNSLPVNGSSRDSPDIAKQPPPGNTAQNLRSQRTRVQSALADAELLLSKLDA